jgi:hypothetical protein
VTYQSRSANLFPAAASTIVRRADCLKPRRLTQKVVEKSKDIDFNRSHNTCKFLFINQASTRIRTGDLLITNHYVAHLLAEAATVTKANFLVTDSIVVNSGALCESSKGA